MADLMEIVGSMLYYFTGALVAISIVYIVLYGLCLAIDLVATWYHKAKSRRQKQ